MLCKRMGRVALRFNRSLVQLNTKKKINKNENVVIDYKASVIMIFLRVLVISTVYNNDDRFD